VEGSSRARADVATLSLWSSGMRSILCTRQKTRASGEYCNKASIAERNCRGRSMLAVVDARHRSASQTSNGTSRCLSAHGVRTEPVRLSTSKT